MESDPLLELVLEELSLSEPLLLDELRRLAPPDTSFSPSEEYYNMIQVGYKMSVKLSFKNTTQSSWVGNLLLFNGKHTVYVFLGWLCFFSLFVCNEKLFKKNKNSTELC